MKPTEECRMQCWSAGNIESKGARVQSQANVRVKTVSETKININFTEDKQGLFAHRCFTDSGSSHGLLA